MKTALDSSVILNLLTDDAQWGQASEESLKRTLGSGPLVIGECVLAVIEPTMKKNA